MTPPVQVRRSIAAVMGAGAVAGAGLTAYAAWEARQYTLRRATVPILPSGHHPLRVLHLSDVHMTPGQTRKQEWLRGLADLRPDLVINTGDNLSHRDSVPVVRDALGPLLDVPGVFVFGSNDYYSPTLRNPLRYLLPDDGQRNVHAPQLPWRDLGRTFTDAGWVDLTNTCTRLKVDGTTFAFAGVDDPHLDYDRLEDVAGPADPDADVRLGVAHAPYLRVLDQFARDGYDAIIAGHTHGGQVCLARARGADHQLRPRPGPRQGPAPAPGRLPARRPGLLVAARVGRPGHQSVHPGADRVPPGGHPADAHADRLSRRRSGPGQPPGAGSRPRVVPDYEGPTGLGYAHRACGPDRLVGPAIGLWRSLVARLVRDEEAAGSNPVSPTLCTNPDPLRRVGVLSLSGRCGRDHDAHVSGTLPGMADEDRGNDGPSLELPSFSFGRRRKRRDVDETPRPDPVPEQAPGPAGEEAPTTVTPPPVVSEPVGRPAPPPLLADDAAMTGQIPPAPPGAVSTPVIEHEPEHEPDREPVTDSGPRRARRSRTLPAVGGMAAAVITGVLVGILTVGLVWASTRLCEVVRGTSSCGGPGYLLMLAIVVAMALLGAVLLRVWHLPEPGSTSVLAVGLMAVVALLLVDLLFSWWMIVVIPAVTALTFALAHRLTASFASADR